MKGASQGLTSVGCVCISSLLGFEHPWVCVQEVRWQGTQTIQDAKLRVHGKCNSKMCIKDSLVLAETTKTGDQLEGMVLDGIVAMSFVWGESVHWAAHTS